MNDKKLIQILLAAVLISSFFLIGAAAVTFFTNQVGSTITVVANGYAMTLYSDAECTTEVTTFSFSQLMIGIDTVSEWVEVYVKFNDNPASQVYGHLTTNSLPSGLSLEGQTYRFLTSVWDDLDIDDGTCDFSNDPDDDTYIPRLRFRVTRTNAAVGSHSFQTVITISDSSTL